MKSTGIVRRIDELGRIVVPKEIRKIFRIDKNEAVEMFVDGDCVILKRFSNFIDKNKLKLIAANLAASTNCPVVIASKDGAEVTERITAASIDSNFAQKNLQNFNLTKTESQTAPKFLDLFLGKFGLCVVAPVTIDLNCEYLIFVLLKQKKLTQTEEALATMASNILSGL